MADNPRIADLRKRLEREPGSRLFAQLAEELRKDGDLEEAIRVARDGLQKNPAYPSARMTLGRALMDTGDLSAAKVEFEAVLKGAADNILASRFLAECLEGTGDVAGAISRYEKTLVLSPGDKHVTARLEELRAKAQPAPHAESPPLPIPLAVVGVEESFELERPLEAPPPPVAPPAAPPVVASPPVAPPPGPASGEGTLGGVVYEFESDEGSVEPTLPPSGRAAAPEMAAAPPAPPAPGGVGTAPAPPPMETVTPPPPPVPAAPWAPQPPPSPAAPRLTQPPVVAPTFEVAPPPAPEAAPASPPLSTATLGELYFNQGFTDKALEVYRQLVEREPGNERARARLTEIEALEHHLKEEEARVPPRPSPGAPADARAVRRQAIERTIGRLEGLLGSLRRG